MSEFLINLTDRERSLLLVMAVFLSMFLLYFGLYRPLDAEKAAASRGLVAAERVYETVQTAAQLAKNTAPIQQAGLRQKDERPLRVIVALTARASGVNITRIQPADTGSVTLWIDSVSPQEFYSWVKKLSEDHGISPTKVSLQKTGNEATVRVQVQFEGASL